MFYFEKYILDGFILKLWFSGYNHRTFTVMLPSTVKLSCRSDIFSDRGPAKNRSYIYENSKPTFSKTVYFSTLKCQTTSSPYCHNRSNCAGALQDSHRGPTFIDTTCTLKHSLKISCGRRLSTFSCSAPPHKHFLTSNALSLMFFLCMYNLSFRWRCILTYFITTMVLTP